MMKRQCRHKEARDTLLSQRLVGALIVCFLALFASNESFAAPASLTYQGRILKSDGTGLEYSHVSFIFQIVDPAGQCVIYQEQVNDIDMTSSGGVFDVAIGNGTIQYPLGGATTILDVFNNASTFTCGSCSLSNGTYTCANGVSSYAAASGDVRKLRVSFYDGTSWKLITPDNTVRSVPFAGYALSAQKLGNNVATDFLTKAGLPNCSSGTFLTWNGTSLSCAAAAGGGGSGTVTSVSGSSPLSVATGTSTPVISFANGSAAGQVHRWDGTSAWVAAKLKYTDLVNATAGNPWPTTTCAAGEAVTWSSASDSFSCTSLSIAASQLTGTIAAARMPAFSGGDVTSSAGSLNLTLATSGVTAGTYSKVTVDAKGRVTTGANIASSDVTTALGFTPLNKAGDVLTGLLGLNGVTSDPAGLNAGDKGKVWFRTDTNEIKYWNGSAAVALGVSGAGLTSLGGQTGNAQTFAVGTTGTAPNWNSATDTHTFNIPMANTASVTAGLISKTEYDTFNSKLGTTLTSAQIFVGNASNVATGVALSGDATISNAGALTIANNAVTSAKINNLAVTDAKINDVGVDKITSGASKYLTYKPNNAACTDGQILSWDNTNTRWVCANDANSGGTVTSITAGTGLTGGAITGSGTIGLGTELTGVNGLSTTGFVQRTGAGAYSTASASTTASNNTLVQRDGSGVSNFYGVGLTGATSGTVTLQAPATVTPYSVTWPSGVAGAANSVLASDTSGNLSWINLGSVAGNINLTSQVTGALPIANGGTNATTAAGARTNLGLGTIATLNSGSAAGNVPVLGTGGLVANQMCTSDGTASGVICTSTIPTSSQWTTSSSNIYFNTGNVGIGTTSPGHTLEVIGFSSGGASAPMITLQQTNAGANANINPAMAIYNYMGTATTGGPSQQFYNARGTSSSATATQSGDSLGTFSGNGYNGSAFNQAASIGFVATGAFSGTSTPAGIYFQTTPSGSTTAVERMRIDSTGYVGIGTSSPSTPLHIFNSTGGARIDTPWSTWGLHLLATDGTTTGTSPSLVLEDVDGGRIRLRKESSSLYVLNTADEYRHKLGGSSTSSSYFANGGGNVGIGTNTPTNKLHVSGGAIVADAQSSSTQCVNFATGNIQVSSYNGTNTINIGGVADGGAYTLVLTGYTSGQTVTVNGYTDTACSSAVTTGVDFGGSSSAVTNTFTAAGNTQLLTFIYSSARGVVYGSAATNFYH